LVYYFSFLIVYFHFKQFVKYKHVDNAAFANTQNHFIL